MPRTPNRVRFALDETPGDGDEEEGGARDDRWTQEEDYLNSDDEGEGEDSRGNRAPLLVAPGRATFEFEELLEGSRPKSGMKMAFMNMANSIIGAGIIGELLPVLWGGMPGLRGRQGSDGVQDNRMRSDKLDLGWVFFCWWH